MARIIQKLFYILCFISGILVCYELQLVAYRQHVSSANIYLTKARQHWGEKFTLQKTNIDSTECWQHEAERMIKGFKNECKVLQDSIVNITTKKDIKANISVKKDGAVTEKIIELNTVVNKPEPRKFLYKKANKKKKWVYSWKGMNKTSHLPLHGNQTDKMAQRIIFNRVPKCGSRSVLGVFKQLAQKNQYNMIDYIRFMIGNSLTKSDMDLLASVVLEINPPFLFERHMYYVDFSKFSSVSIKYINIIRDPIEQFTSMYYFMRFGDGQKRDRGFRLSESERIETFSECVLRRRPQCSGNNLSYIIPFFCGHSQQCLYKNRTSLELAKQNVEHDFIVVGLLEELEDTFAVLEKMLPRLFTGAVNFLKKPASTKLRLQTKTIRKEPPSEEVYAILLEQMALEYEFYNYIKERFHKLKLQLGVGGGTKNQAGR